MTKKVRKIVHDKCGGRCAYCGEEIEYGKMQVDHIHPKKKGGKDEMSNYNPSCRRCNFYKSVFTLNQFRGRMATLHERIETGYIVKVGIDYGIVTIKPFDGKFYFEKLEGEDEKCKS